MSLARVHIVKSARVRKYKDGSIKPNLHCGNCDTEIKPGMSYRWFEVGFRGYKQVRCIERACFPANSTLESSKLSAVYAAIESATDDINATGDLDEIKDAISDCAEAVREVAEEYREASVNPMTGVVFNTDAEERAESLDSAADELEGWDPEGDPDDWHCDEHDEFDDQCEDCDDAHEEGISEVRDQAISALDEVLNF